METIRAYAPPVEGDFQKMPMCDQCDIPMVERVSRLTTEPLLGMPDVSDVPHDFPAHVCREANCSRAAAHDRGQGDNEGQVEALNEGPHRACHDFLLWGLLGAQAPLSKLIGLHSFCQDMSPLLQGRSAYLGHTMGM